MHTPDYLVVGGGAAGLAFADSLLAESSAEILLVDKRTGVGGHWRDTYPFVRLHSPSAYYGVNSRPLGENALVESGHNKGFYEQATGAEVTTYFEGTLSQRLAPSGQVEFLGGQEFLGCTDGVAQLRDVGTGAVSEVTVRRRVVDARYQEASIPATHTPTFTVDADADVVPVGLLPDRADDAHHYTVIGAGKTAADACLWLLDRGTDPDLIRWVRPRDMWYTDRAQLQPLDQVGALIGGIADDAEAGAQATDLVDFAHRLEAAGRFLRLDKQVEPTMYRGTMVSRSEWCALRQISDVVRLGRLRAVDHRLRLAEGDLPVRPDTLHVDCSAVGLAPSPAVPVFAKDAIRLQQVRHNSPCFNAALIAYLEAHRDGDVEKNRLAPPNAYPSTTADLARMLTRTWITAVIWQDEPEVQAWIDGSRLNLLQGLVDRLSDPTVSAGVTRYFTNLEAAIRRLPTLT